ncbi:MAG: plasmid stability protein StbB, partial [Pseudohongiella sp.]|nr:plasmid stability protein StbB [Pseudohongiella sp.]
LFDALGAKGITIGALLADETDYKALIKNNPDASAKERSHWGDMHGLKALARSVNRNLDSVFSTLFK